MKIREQIYKKQDQVVIFRMIQINIYILIISSFDLIKFDYFYIQEYN